MGIQAKCPHCGKTYHLRDEMHGKQVRCKMCSATFSVPSPTGEVPSDGYGQQFQEVQGAAGQRPPTKIHKPSGVIGWVLLSVAIVLGCFMICCGCFAFVPGFIGNQMLAESQTGPRRVVTEHHVEQTKPTSIDSALRDLASSDANQRVAAAIWFARTDVDASRQNQVASALTPLLSDENASVQSASAQALTTWATTESVPAITAVLGNHDEFNHHNLTMRRLLLTTLTRLKDPRSAEAVAKRLASNFDRRHAIRALQAIGPDAEPAIVNQLQHSDWKTRREICKVLSQMGTETCLPALEATAENDENSTVQRAAKDARDSILARTGSPPKVQP